MDVRLASNRRGPRLLGCYGWSDAQWADQGQWLGRLGGCRFRDDAFITFFWLMGRQSAIRLTDTHIAVTTVIERT
jgi:hypothetical protein